MLLVYNFSQNLFSMGFLWIFVSLFALLERAKSADVEDREIKWETSRTESNFGPLWFPQSESLNYAKRRHNRSTSNCKNNQFTCLSTQCIDQSFVCDGKDDCSDGSDESSTLCYNMRCPDDYISCYYGACINKALLCNGVENCRDGSDENITICSDLRPKEKQGGASLETQYANQSTSSPPVIILRVETSTVLTKENSTTATESSTSQTKENITTATESSTSQTKENSTTATESSTSQNETNMFTCFSGAKINESLVCDGINDCYDGSDETIAQCIGLRCPGYLFQCDYGGCIEKAKRCNGEEDCKDGSDESSCGPDEDTPFKYCPKLATDSVDITCFQVGKKVNCSLTFWPGTVVTGRCKPAYNRPTPFRGSTEIKCLQGGRWNHQLFSCVPDCGKKYIAKPLSWHAPTTNSIEYPWHVGLYSDLGNTYLCGGSIISTKAVITAAHCVFKHWDKPGEVLIAVGKIWRSWNISEPDEQKFKGALIVMGRGYRGKNSGFAGDIAVVGLDKHIKISLTVMPLCFDWDGIYPPITTGTGTVVGWGKTELGGLSNKLRVAQIPIYSADKCENIVHPLFISYITPDKFCGGNKGVKDGHRLDQGDSGGSLVFTRKVNDQDLYYLTGIVSIAHALTPDDVSFTNVTDYTSWLKSVVSFIGQTKKIKSDRLIYKI